MMNFPVCENMLLFSLSILHEYNMRSAEHIDSSPLTSRQIDGLAYILEMSAQLTHYLDNSVA